MIVATAGHIDHGKTLLVKTLTGTDTDRLPEEKARGISIDLGFAYLPLAEGGLIGFVDVPGHERFIRNMLAGVSGIDFALLIVAAESEGAIWMDSETCAMRAGVDERTLRKWANAGKITKKGGRYDYKSIRAAITGVAS